MARGAGRKGSGGKKPWRRRLGCLLFVVLVLGVPAAGGGWLWWQVTRPYQGYPGSERFVTVAPGTGAVHILEQLQHEGVLADAAVARAYLVFVLRNPPIQAGDYRFAGPLTLPQVLRKLIRGEVVTKTATVVPGWAMEEIADQLAAAGLGRREVFLQLMHSPELVSDLDPAARDLEGYLFPETYKFRLGTSEREVVATLVKTFRQRFAKQVRPLLDGNPPPLHALVTLASIVEKEAKASAERPVIAGVYHNRLERGIALAADPTVIYALKKLGRWDGNIHHDDLRVDSPYNTYRYAGLPPGPICSPGAASLQAAAQPADVPYLYFVSRNDGTHVFATTLEEHSRNVQQWQVRYWREKRTSAGGGAKN
jgi:UPF0755 protein